MTTASTTPRAARHDDGFALITVLGAAVVITLFLLTTLAYALNNAPLSRKDQDAKAAVAAAQAGIEEFTSRLTADDTYYANTAEHANNPAFSASGTPVPGTSGQASFRYELLTTELETTLDGLIRLRVVGKSRGVERDLTATLTPDGFLKYLYFTDLETLDPALYRSPHQVQLKGVTSVDVELQTGPGKGGGTKAWFRRTWYVDRPLVDAACKRYYYAGRYDPKHTSGSYVQVDKELVGGAGTAIKEGGIQYTNTLTASSTDWLNIYCLEIAFSADDVINGPLHSNDALQLVGPATFAKLAGTSWGPGEQLAQPADGKLWWGDKTVAPPAEKPSFVPVVQMPTSNDVLKTKADPLTPGNDAGCLYTGQTQITFEGTKMRVLSPGTTSSVPRCYNTATPNSPQLLDIPAVIYVQGGPCGTTDVPFPMKDTSGNVIEALGRLTTTYDCSHGNAFVSGVLSGRTTVGTSHDVVITGDTTYQAELAGADALGLIPQGFAWVYHPVSTDGTNLLDYSAAVRKIDAAILSVSHSFIVQNYQQGAALSTAGDEASKLRVRGAILQKHRGPVGKGGTTPSGYLKNYIYDERLLNAPPPFFLRPVSAPWKVSKVTD